METPRWPAEDAPIASTILEGTPSPKMLSEMHAAVERRYRIRGQDSGGYGVAWTVYDAARICYLTLKTYRPDRFTGPEGRAAIEAEARRWLGVPPHPNVVTAESFEVLEGFPFIVLEHVSGGSLKARLDRGALSDDELVALLVDVCAGMLHLTALGIACHRDLSPANILLTKGGRAKITDLGSAALTNARGGREIVPAALPYMAPEQFHHQEDIRSDIYAFGMVLYHGLAGHPAFALPPPSDRPGGGPNRLMTIYAKHKAEPLPRLAPPRSSIAKAIEHLLYVCTAKQPHERYGDFGSLLASLESRLGGLPRRDSAGTADSGQPIPLPVVERKAAALQALGRQHEASVLLDGVPRVGADTPPAILIETLRSRSKVFEQRGRAALAAGDHEVAAGYLEAALDVLALPALGRNPELGAVVRARTVPLIRLRAIALEAMGETELAAAVRAAGDVARAADTDTVPLEESVSERDTAATGHVGRSAAIPRPAERLADEGRQRAIDGDHETAVRRYRDALTLDPGHRIAQIELGISLNELGRYEEAIAALGEALRRWPNEPAALTDMGFSLERLGRYEEAISFYRRALRADPTNPMPLVNLGQCHLLLHAYHEARGCFEELLVARPNQALGLHGMLRATVGMGDHDAALDACEALIAINEPLDDAPAISLLEHLTATRQYASVMRIITYLLGDGGTERFIFGADDAAEPEVLLNRLKNIERVAEMFATVPDGGSDGILLRGFRCVERRTQPGFVPGHYDRIVGDLIRCTADTATLQRLETQASRAIAARPERPPSDGAAVKARLVAMSSEEKQESGAPAERLSDQWIDVLQVAWQQHGYQPDRTSKLVDAMFALGQKADYQGSLRHACRALAENPYDVRCLNGAGICLRRLEFPHLAVLAYEHTLFFTPLDHAVHHNLGLVYIELERWNDAIHHFEEALTLNPNSPSDLGLNEALDRRAGESTRGSDRPAAASQLLADATTEIKARRLWKAEALLRAASVEPGGEPALEMLGGLYYMGGRYAEAAKTFETLLHTSFRTVRPAAERRRAAYALGMAQGKVAIASNDRGMYHKAVASLEQSLGEPADPETLHLIGGLHRRFEDHVRAVEVLETAARVLPGNDTVHAELALSLSAIGAHARAVTEAEMAVRLKPDEPLHHQTLREVRRRLTDDAVRHQGAAGDAGASSRSRWHGLRRFFGRV